MFFYHLGLRRKKPGSQPEKRNQQSSKQEPAKSQVIRDNRMRHAGGVANDHNNRNPQPVAEQGQPDRGSNQKTGLQDRQTGYSGIHDRQQAGSQQAGSALEYFVYFI